jgi:hypothetical protein
MGIHATKMRLMSKSESWENNCTGCGNEVKVDLHPGKRAYHLTCGSCPYSENSSKCAFRETVAHCEYALSYLKNLKPKAVKKRCCFSEQLTGEENLYHVLQFVNSHQDLAEMQSEKRYLENLKRVNLVSSCLKRSS